MNNTWTKELTWKTCLRAKRDSKRHCLVMHLHNELLRKLFIFFIAFFLQAVPNFMRPALKSINSSLWLSKGSSLKKKKNSLLVNRNCILRWFKWNQHCTHLFFSSCRSTVKWCESDSLGNFLSSVLCFILSYFFLCHFFCAVF